MSRKTKQARQRRERERAAALAGPPADSMAAFVLQRADAGDPAYCALRDARACFWCGTAVAPRLPGRHDCLSFDHYVPRVAGGGDEAENLKPSCTLCNRMRGHMAPDRFRAIVEDLVRPDRDDLPALGRTLLDAGHVDMARAAWTYSGMDRGTASMIVFERLGEAGFDVGTKQGIEDLASVRRRMAAPAVRALPDDRLVGFSEGFPPRSEVRRRRSAEAAGEMGLQDAVRHEMKRRKLRHPVASADASEG